MASIRETIESLLKAKKDTNGSASYAKGQSLMQYAVNDKELVLLQAALIADGGTFTEEFYNIENETYLIWDSVQQLFINKIDGELVLMEILIDDFETGDFTGTPYGSWNLVNGGENDWEVGTAAVSTGTFGCYISNDGGVTNTYSSIGGGLDVSHMYLDIPIPAGATNSLQLQFDWRCEAEVGFDWSEVFDAPTSVTPVANTEVSGIYTVGQSEYNNQSTFTTETIDLDTANAGSTRRFIFSWRNDTSVENQPPMAIDNIKLLYA